LSAEPSAPMTTSPVPPFAASRTARAARDASTRALRAPGRKAVPDAVSCTRRLVRSKSTAPSSASRRAIRWLRDGCVTRIRSAARPKCSSSATARNARRSRSSIDNDTLSNESVTLLFSIDATRFTGFVPDVIVIGAGVVGAATAYALTEAEAQVTVLDGGQVAAGTSAATFAVDITRTKTPRTLFELSLASAREHASLQRRWTSSRWLHQAASLEWERTERDRQRVRDRVRRMHTWGYPAQWMSSQQVRDFEPALTLPTGEAAEVAYYPDGAWYEPPVLARALLKWAQQRRASMHVNDPVTAIATGNGRISEVTTAAGRRLSADVVVNCAGPQAADIAALGGAELPLRQVPGLVVTTTPAPTGLRAILCAADLNLRPHRGDRVVLHSWLLDGELGERPEPARRLALAQHLLHRAQALLPGLAPAVVQSALVGVRPVPLDGLPVVGFLPDVDNLYVVVSHSAVHLAPVLGRLAASEISGVRLERLDPFRPTRFCPGDQERDVLDDNTRTMLSCINPLSAQEPSNAV